MHAIAGYDSNVVDLYNSATLAWTTAQLSVARSNLAATSFGNMAIFAGGFTISSCELLCWRVTREQTLWWEQVSRVF
jgi:hypothetical protein